MATVCEVRHACKQYEYSPPARQLQWEGTSMSALLPHGSGPADDGRSAAPIATNVHLSVGSSLQHLMHRLLEDNLHRGLTLKGLSRCVGYSEKYCSEWFVARMGQSFSSYVKELRIARATKMLQSPVRLADIAEQLGFQDQYAFSHFFKKATGVSPKAFRERGLAARALSLSRISLAYRRGRQEYREAST
jgi:AraC-like DNA-binding protein